MIAGLIHLAQLILKLSRMDLSFSFIKTVHGRPERLLSGTIIDVLHSKLHWHVLKINFLNASEPMSPTDSSSLGTTASIKFGSYASYRLRKAELLTIMHYYLEGHEQISNAPNR